MNLNNSHLKLKRLAIVPARSGSTRLRDKNIKSLNGHPLMAYTIMAAINSKLFDKVIVSTDSIKYAKIAQQYGAEVDFMRPQSLATETSTSVELIRYTWGEYFKRGLDFEHVCLLQPTSPLRKSTHIKAAITIYTEKNVDSLISVCKEKINKHEVLGVATEKHLRIWSPNNFKNKAPEIFYPNGAIYIFNSKFIMDSDYYYSTNTLLYLMDDELSLDIDSIEDFDLVESKVINKPQLLEDIL